MKIISQNDSDKENLGENNKKTTKNKAFDVGDQHRQQEQQIFIKDFQGKKIVSQERHDSSIHGAIVSMEESSNDFEQKIESKIGGDAFVSYDGSKKKIREVSDFEKRLLKKFSKEEIFIINEIKRDIRIIENIIKRIKENRREGKEDEIEKFQKRKRFEFSEKKEKILDYLISTKDITTNKTGRIHDLDKKPQSHKDIGLEEKEGSVSPYKNKIKKQNFARFIYEKNLSTIKKEERNKKKKIQKIFSIKIKDSPLSTILQKKKNLLKKIENIFITKSKTLFTNKSVKQLYELRKSDFMNLDHYLHKESKGNLKKSSMLSRFEYEEYKPVYKEITKTFSISYVKDEDNKTKKPTVIYEHNPEYLGTLYEVRFALMNSRDIYNLASPEHVLPVEHDIDDREEKKKKIAEEYIRKFNESVGFYDKLEKSLQEEGIRNPIIVVSGEPRFVSEDLVDRDYLQRVPYERRLYCEQLGGSRLYISQKHGWWVPVIICDWTGHFSSYKTLKSVEEINNFFMDKTEIYFTRKGLKVVPPRHVHLDEQHQSSSLMSKIRKEFFDERKEKKT